MAKIDKKRISIRIMSGLVAGIVFGLTSLILFKYVFKTPNVTETVFSIGIVISATVLSYRICYEEILRYKNDR